MDARKVIELAQEARNAAAILGTYPWPAAILGTYPWLQALAAGLRARADAVLEDAGQPERVLTRDEARTLINDRAAAVIAFFETPADRENLVEDLASAIEGVAYARGRDAEDAQVNLRTVLHRWVRR